MKTILSGFFFSLQHSTKYFIGGKQRKLCRIASKNKFSTKSQFKKISNIFYQVGATITHLQLRLKKNILRPIKDETFLFWKKYENCYNYPNILGVTKKKRKQTLFPEHLSQLCC